jgi:PAS domain S-box-containing protein
MVKVEILGQLLLMQSMLINLPDKNSIFSFVCRGLTDIPGVDDVKYYQTNKFTADKSIVTFSVGKGKSKFGEVKLTVSDYEAYAPYKQYLENFFFMIEVILEERRQRQINELHKAELEQRVKERTVQLTNEIKERKIIEESLRDSEALFRASFENTSAGACLVNIDGTFIKINKRFVELLGYTQDELRNKHFNDITHSEDRELGVTRMKKLLKGEISSAIFEKRYVHKMGHSLYALVSVGIIRNTDNSPRNLITFVQDIGPQKEAEKKLREQELQYRNLADAGLALIWTTDTNKLCNYFNEPWLKFTGRTIEQELGFGWAENVHPEDMDRCLKIFTEAFDKRKTFDMEYRLKHVSGEYRWIRDLGTPNYNTQGRFLGYIGHCFDVSQRKRTEMSRRIQYRIAQSILTARNLESLLGVIQKDLSQLLDTSNFFLALHNTDKDVFQKVFSEDEHDKFSEWPVSSSLSGFVLNTEKTLLLQGAETQKFLEEEKRLDLIGTPAKSWLGVPIRVGNKTVGVLVIQSYEEKQAYQPDDVTLFEMIAHEIGLFIERKNMVKDLLAAKLKAEESDRLKSAFLANMSHEIRTPMNGILGFADLLKNPRLSGEKQQKYIDIIERSGARMLNIINDIIDISKIEAGLMKISKETTNVNDQIEYICSFFKIEAEAKSLNLTFKNDLPREKAFLQTDREKLYAILTNLIKNALKYTNEGYVQIGYDYLNEPENAVYRFFVKDTGVGIPDKKKHTIFERFVQVDNDKQKIREGAGLGLSITKAYVEMLGGNIWLESAEGSGTVFYFTLPHQQISKHQNTEPTYLPADTFDILQELKLNILIAEDDEISEMLIKTNIDRVAGEIVSVKNGSDAVSICRSRPDLDLVLMDIRMPKMNGYEAARQIRQFNEDIIIIAQTAYALSGDREKALKAGCNDHITKPVKQDVLLGMIHKFFNNNLV